MKRRRGGGGGEEEVLRRRRGGEREILGKESFQGRKNFFRRSPCHSLATLRGFLPGLQIEARAGGLCVGAASRHTPRVSL